MTSSRSSLLKILLLSFEFYDVYFVYHGLLRNLMPEVLDTSFF